MNEVWLSFFLRQLTHAMPLLLAYVFGLVYGVVNFRRHPSAAFLTLFSCGLMMASTVGTLIIAACLWQAETEGTSTMRFAEMTSLVGGIGTVIHACAIGLLVFTVFYGRRGNAQVD